MPSGDPEEWAEAASARTDRLQALLPGLVTRGVPVRLLEPGPVTGVARMRMADGTTFLVASASPAALSRVIRALALRHSALLVSGWERSAEGLELSISGVPGRGPVKLWVRGPDQPD